MDLIVTTQAIMDQSRKGGRNQQKPKDYVAITCDRDHFSDHKWSLKWTR